MPEAQPRVISNRAADDLTYIRSAMERASAFTAVPGAGGVVTGVIGVIAAVVGARQPTGERWLATWLGAASIAGVVELAAVTWKARRAGIALTGKSAHRFNVWLGIGFGGLHVGFGAYIARYHGG